jgi:hypothetical protein
MKNSQIHKGLKDNHIRDFLALQLVKIFEEEAENNQLKPLPPIEDILEHTILTSEQEIQRLTKQIQFLRSKQAIIQLIKKQGWDEFDVSDETVKDLPYKLKMNFIGTKKEYNHLLEIINGK